MTKSRLSEDKLIDILIEHGERIAKLEQNAHDINSKHSTLAIKINDLIKKAEVLDDKTCGNKRILDPTPLNPIYCKTCGKKMDNMIDAIQHEMEIKEGICHKETEADKAVVR